MYRKTRQSASQKKQDAQKSTQRAKSRKSSGKYFIVKAFLAVVALLVCIKIYYSFEHVPDSGELVTIPDSVILPEDCINFITNPENFDKYTSQFSQDYVIFNSVMNAIPFGEGVFIDLAAQYPKHWSNTWFFEVTAIFLNLFFL